MGRLVPPQEIASHQFLAQQLLKHAQRRCRCVAHGLDRQAEGLLEQVLAGQLLPGAVRWRRGCSSERFLVGGIDALRKDAPRSGRPATVTAEVESRIVHATLRDKPANATHWSTRTLAEHLGLGATTIRRVWRCNGIKPHLSRTFKLSRDPPL